MLFVVWLQMALGASQLTVTTDRPVVVFINLKPHPLQPGSTGLQVDFPNGKEGVQRVAIRTTDITLRNDVERPGLRVDVAVEPGDSGAMVHLPGGGVGIIWSRSTATAEQAWTVDVPPELIDASTRRALIDPVDVGPCL